MVNSVAGVIGWGSSDGQLTAALATRWATISSFDIVGAATPLQSRGGIIPAGGTPLACAAQGTPNMTVALTAGRIFVPGNGANVPGFAVVLTANTNLDIATSHATLPRIDLVVVEVVSTGSVATPTFKILTGTPAASPARPTPTNSGNTHSIAIAQVNVGAAVTSITAPNVTVTSVDAGWTAAPGGSVLVPGAIALSTTPRQALAASLAPGTPVWDSTARVMSVTASGDLCPIMPRILYDVATRPTVSTNSATPVTSATSGTLNIFGGNRIIQIIGAGHLTSDSSADADYQWQRAFLDGSGVTGINSITTQFQARVRGPAAFSRTSFYITHNGVGSGTSISIQLKLLLEANIGTGANAFMENGRLQVIDMGPA